jgi:signal transduction histidine kinase
VIERFATQAGDQFVFELRCEDDLPAVYADYDRTRTVLENLVSNAIKYSPEGGTIRVAARAEGQHLLVSVSDQGIGIAAEDQARIFERFYRVDNRLRRETQGVGLGLFLSRAIVEAQGGRIWVDSQPARGTRFSLTLPFAVRRLADGEVRTEDSEPRTKN